MLGIAALRSPAWRRVELPALDAKILQPLTVALLAAALSETVLLRLVTRVGVHLPKHEAIRTTFETASFFGSLAFNFASVLTIVLVVLFLGSLVVRTVGGGTQLALAALSLAMLGGLAFSLATNSAAADALFGLAITLLVGLLGLVIVRQKDITPQARLALALIVFAYFCYQYYTLTFLLYRLIDDPGVPPMSVPALRLGEGLVVLAGGAVFWAWGLARWRGLGRRWLAVVAVLVAAIGLSSLSPGSTVSILALWTTGLSLFLPFPLYLISLGLFLVTLLACWRSGDAFWAMAGLLLVLLAGYMPEATYHHLLLLLGVAFLGGAALSTDNEAKRPKIQELRAG